MASCGLLVRVADAILLPFFALIAIAAPLVDAQTVLPSSLFPEFLADLKSQYATFSGDYLIAKKPPFFVGLVFYELIVQWPLSLANLYGLIASKPWFRTTCLAYGVSASTSMRHLNVHDGRWRLCLAPVAWNTDVLNGGSLEVDNSGSQDATSTIHHIGVWCIFPLIWEFMSEE
ncbi:transmembrane protein 97 isoform X1 [Amborella trichopoda]|uniref:transmembrane protein 97 isoform X1 n=1 Tax=Amborella trichopoda TaxID=13333 RepID=UPI0009C16441|nr:transmembrane protein 97 isoform X1 [Amborella trichopoda]|eukprot:XP_020531617.1 transmembrane protein 97 isoform X1 [Amborella trichopoda]